LFNAEIQLSQAAREGARIAALGATAGDPVMRAKAAAPSFGGVITGTAIVCPAAPAAGADGVVTVRFAFTFFLPLLPDRTLTQTARMRCGG